MRVNPSTGGAIALVAFCLTVFAAWITHIVVCLKMMTTASMILMVIGAFIFPVGVIHGIGSWFGIF